MKSVQFLIILLSCFLAQNLTAQVGLKFGIHSFDLSSPKDIILEDQTLEFREAKLGFQAGLSARLDLKVFYLEPRFMLNSTKVQYNIKGENGSIIDNIRTESFTNLDIPLLVGFNLLFVDAFVGPVAHLHLDSTSDVIDFKNYESLFKAANYGWRAGFGFELGGVDISLEYEGNFSSYGDHIRIDGQQFNFGDNPSRILINLGFKLF